MTIEEEIEERRKAAEADEGYQARCVEGEKVFFYEAGHGYVPGHIYSKPGMAEYHISKACEYHFDSWFKEDD